MRIVLILILTVFPLFALEWSNTGELAGAGKVYDLIAGPGGALYAAAVLDTSATDSGQVFISTNLVDWERGGDIPGDVKRLMCLAVTSGDTLLAGTRSVYNGADSGHLYHSADSGRTWAFRSRLRGTYMSNTITAFLEGSDGRFHAAHNFLSGMRGATPCYSTDRGYTWNQGPTSTFNGHHYCLVESADSAVLCGTWGTGGRVLKTTSGGYTWPPTGEMFDAGHVPSIVEGPAGVIYAGTYPKTAPQENIGRVFRTTNGGVLWNEVGYGYLSSTTGISAVCRASDGILYAGSRPNGEVFASSDDGSTWVSTGTLNGATIVYRLLEVTRGDSSFLYAATGPNGNICRALISAGVSVEDVPRPGLHRLSVRPNPCRDWLDIRVEQDCCLELWNSAGIRVGSFSARVGSNRFRVNGLPAGAYLLRRPSGGSQRFVLVRN